jgi:hypothetical protein
MRSILKTRPIIDPVVAGGIRRVSVSNYSYLAIL